MKKKWKREELRVFKNTDRKLIGNEWRWHKKGRKLDRNGKSRVRVEIERFQKIFKWESKRKKWIVCERDSAIFDKHWKERENK